MQSIRRDISADYYGIINSDILISDRIFLVMDQIDAMVQRGTLKPIVVERTLLIGREDSRASCATFTRSICWRLQRSSRDCRLLRIGDSSSR